MANNCGSDPSVGCDNSAIVGAISSSSNAQLVVLNAISTKLTTINTTLTDCCENIDTRNAEIIRLLTLIANK
jgi:hypothetical protein